MGSASERIRVARILRTALVLSVLLYPVVAVLALGPPRWQAPWIPSGTDETIVLLVLTAMALGDSVAGWLVGGLRQPPRFMAATADPASFGFLRFIVGLALIESAAIFGLVLSLVMHDPRYAIVFSAPVVLLMLLIPRVETTRAEASVGR